jgi:hypothetical protein
MVSLGIGSAEAATVEASLNREAAARQRLLARLAAPIKKRLLNKVETSRNLLIARLGGSSIETEESPEILS